MFDKTQYIIEMTLGGLVPFSRDTYSIKDTFGNLLGYAKKQRLKLWPRFWFEETDGTRMGEIRSSKQGYQIYDVKNRLQGTIKQKPVSPSKRRKGLLGIALFISGLLLAMFGVVVYFVTTPTTGLLAAIFSGGALTVLGVFYLVSTYQRPEWRVEGPEGRQLAEIREASKFFAEYQVLTPDGRHRPHTCQTRSCCISILLQDRHHTASPRSPLHPGLHHLESRLRQDGYLSISDAQAGHGGARLCIRTR